MDPEVRTISPAEVGAFARSASIPFLELGDLHGAAHWARVLEPDRTWVVVDGDRFVGNCCVFSRNLTLPGGSGGICPTVPVAAVSGVGVHPTHRRRGLLTQMMSTMIDDARRRGEPMAALLASEAVIYGRFGFGLTTSTSSVAIDTGRSAFRTSSEPLRLTLMESDEAVKVVPELFERLRANRAGEVNRDAGTWADIFADPEERRDGGTARYWAVSDRGYLAWRAKGSSVALLDLYGATPEVEASLWRFALDLDLVDLVTAPHRPIDEMLRWRLADPRRLRVTAINDLLWTRVIDLPRVLEARGYPVAEHLVLDVEAPPSSVPSPDPAVGRFVLDTGPDGASCRPAMVGETADLRLGMADVGSLALGGVSASLLLRAGRVVEHRSGAVAAADRLFMTGTAPYTGTSF